MVNESAEKVMAGKGSTRTSAVSVLTQPDARSVAVCTNRYVVSFWVAFGSVTPVLLRVGSNNPVLGAQL